MRAEVVVGEYDPDNQSDEVIITHLSASEVQIEFPSNVAVMFDIEFVRELYFDFLKDSEESSEEWVQEVVAEINTITEQVANIREALSKS